MHGKLRQTDIRRLYGNVGIGDIPQSASSRLIRMIDEDLAGDPFFFTESSHIRPGVTVRGIALSRTEFQHDALIHLGTLDRIILSHMCRMTGMGIIRRYHETVGQSGIILLPAPSQVLTDPVDQRLQEIRIRSLSGTRPHLFVIEYAEHPDIVCILRLKEALQGTPDTFLIIQSGRSQEFVTDPPDHTRLPGIQEKIVSQNIFHCDACFLCNKFHETALLLRRADDGKHITLKAVFIS